MLGIIRNTLKSPLIGIQRLLHTTTPNTIEDKKWNYKKIPADDEGAQGEKVIDLDSMIKL